mgnify:CR=1 FL=1|tara:strand:+ start:4697 stop:5212 length:516 start_codon:yes stop_codon:yes gene_type:complete
MNINSTFGSKTSEVEALISPHLQSLYRYAFRLSGQKSAAEDLVQDTLLYILEHRVKFISLDPVKPWMMRCLYHRFVDNYRRYNRYEALSDGLLESLKTQEDSTETAFIAGQIRTFVGLLTPAQRTAVTLFDIEGYTIKEISEILEIPEGTVKSHLARGRRIIKEKISMQPF